MQKSKLGAETTALKGKASETNVHADLTETLNLRSTQSCLYSSYTSMALEEIRCNGINPRNKKSLGLALRKCPDSQNCWSVCPGEGSEAAALDV